MQLHIFMVEDAILQKEVLGTLHVLAKKNIHPIEIENHAKVFFRSFNNAPFQVSGINITKNVYRTKNLYTFLKNFFSCNAQNQNISYNKKIIIFKCSGI